MNPEARVVESRRGVRSGEVRDSEERSVSVCEVSGPLSINKTNINWWTGGFSLKFGDVRS